VAKEIKKIASDTGKDLKKAGNQLGKDVRKAGEQVGKISARLPKTPNKLSRKPLNNRSARLPYLLETRNSSPITRCAVTYVISVVFLLLSEHSPLSKGRYRGI
jgi:hypothetical protein